jgi:nitrate/nitrite-specific signal transduction histidine kinase
MERSRQLSKKDKILLAKLYYIGMPTDILASFFNQKIENVYKLYAKHKHLVDNKTYTLYDTSQLLTEFILSDITRNLQEMTRDERLRLLPELLKIKQESISEEAKIAEMYIPTKKESENQQSEEPTQED